MTTHFDEASYEKEPRAGLIPYIWDHETDTIHYLMMVASDPKFGGPRPMISKGKIEDGETPMSTAIREAEEELGFVQRNKRGDYHQLFFGRQVLRSCAYDLTVYGVEVQSRWDFDKWCEETQYVEWHTLESFKTHGRRDHLKFIEALEEFARSKST